MSDASFHQTSKREHALNGHGGRTTLLQLTLLKRLLYETIVYIKLGEHVKKNEMKFFMAGSTRLRYFAASTQGKHGSTGLKHFTAQLLRLRLRLPGLDVIDHWRRRLRTCIQSQEDIMNIYCDRN